MDDYRSSSLFRGDSSYAPSSPAYLNPSVSPTPSSAFDLDGRVVFKRQRLREDSPERSQDIWDWVRGVERRRHASISTPDSFVGEYGLLSEQPTNESYLRSSPCHGMSYLRLTAAHIPIFIMFKHPSPSHPPRCLAPCQREWETITLRMTPHSSIPQDAPRPRWSMPRPRLQDRQPSTTQECRAFCPGLRTRRRIHPSNRRASRIRLLRARLSLLRRRLHLFHLRFVSFIRAVGFQTSADRNQRNARIILS